LESCRSRKQQVPYVPDPNIFEKAANALREFNASRRSKVLERFLERSRYFEGKLEAESKRFEIDLHRLKTGNYYEALGIRYTSDPKAIKGAYYGLMKRYHPDVSENADAEEQAKRINEAYAVLKDKRLKEEYDSSSSRGEASLSAESSKEISKELKKHYSELREKDLKVFKEITSVPLRKDALVAAIENMCAWEKRFDKAAHSTFADFKRYEKAVRKLGAMNRRMLQSEKDASNLSRLKENGRRLDDLTLACGKVDKGLLPLTRKVRTEIGVQEAPVVKRLRSYM